MNGVCDIRIEGVTYPLLFNIQANEELTASLMENPSPSNFKIMSDMIYAGMVGYAASEGIKYPARKDVYALCEKFLEEDDSKEQYEAVDKCYCTSTWGKKTIEDLDETKKKMEAITTQITGTS